jgi:hypothetical protein
LAEEWFRASGYSVRPLQSCGDDGRRPISCGSVRECAVECGVRP